MQSLFFTIHFFAVTFKSSRKITFSSTSSLERMPRLTSRRVTFPMLYNNTMVALVPLLLFLFMTTTHCLSESEAILNFKNFLVIGKADALATWNAKTPLCTWAGVLCNEGSVSGLKVENLELSGSINIEALKELKSLRTLSFMNNKFSGPFPEFKKLDALKSLYLSNNQFEGEIPMDAFEGMGWLKKLHLAKNKFTSEIPVSLSKLPKLLELRLEENNFIGAIPNFEHKLQMLNLSNNALTGVIPESLNMMDPKVFEGNKGLCGKPLEIECDSPLEVLPPQLEKRPKPSSRVTLVIASIITTLTLLIIIVVLILFNRKYKKKEVSLVVEYKPSNLQKKTGIKEVDDPWHSKQHKSGLMNGLGNDKRMPTTSGTYSTKLSFLREDGEIFDLRDLLEASAEILGSGCFGASYKILLPNGSIMVVKRFKHMNNAGRDDFQEHMKRLGRLRHPNLLPVVAYYYRKEEKLLVCDFSDKGSLAVNLHGHQSLGIPSLDWPTRLKIIKGVSKGLLYLHQDLPTLMAPHGHLKSSNVLLTKNFEPLLTDYGLIPVINQEKAQEHMMAYKSPEYLQHRRVTKKTDVWGLGVLILEILTGKFPTYILQGGNKSEEDLVSWVKSRFKGVWTPGLFDKEMCNTNYFEGEILKLLRIGLICCEPDVDKRMEIGEVMEMIDELKEREGDDDDFYSTYVSETDWRSSRGVSSESIQFL